MARSNRNQAPRPAHASCVDQLHQQPPQSTQKDGANPRGITIKGIASGRIAKQPEPERNRKPSKQRFVLDKFDLRKRLLSNQCRKRIRDSVMTGSPYNTHKCITSEPDIKSDETPPPVELQSKLDASAPAFKPQLGKKNATRDRPAPPQEKVISLESLLRKYIIDHTWGYWLHVYEADDTLQQAGCDDSPRSRTLEAIFTIVSVMYPTREERLKNIKGVVLKPSDLTHPPTINALHKNLPDLWAIYLTDLPKAHLPTQFSLWHLARKFRSLLEVHDVDVTNLRSTKLIEMSTD